MKKKLFAGILTLSAIFFMSLPCFAKIGVSVDSKPLSFDVAPKIVNDRTMVPMRAIFDALGAEISWDDATKTVTAVKDSTVIKTTIGSKLINVNNEIVEIDTAPIIENSRTLVPVRFISESLGYRVRWDGEASTVYIMSDDFLEVHFIDVGQADCSLIIQGDNAMLVDGGNRADGEAVVAYIKNQGIDRLDYVVCTHGHEDHVGGLPYIIENVKTDIIISDDDYDSSVFSSFISTAAENNIPIKEPAAGDNFTLGGCHIEILGPVADSYSDYNDSSVVFRLVFDNTSFLFMGDAGYAAEEDILSMGVNINSDVLKTGHHGSNTASSDAFISAVSPNYAIISCGAGNSYGHPHKETISTFANYGVMYFRTDVQGHITASSDGDTVSFSSAPNKPQTTTSKGSYIGNKNSKKLHLPSCSSLPAEKNREYFNSLQAALTEGYTACGICKPN